MTRGQKKKKKKEHLKKSSRQLENTVTGLKKKKKELHDECIITGNLIRSVIVMDYYISEL